MEVLVGMTKDEFITAASKLENKRVTILANIVAPAKAACNAMKDAGMKNTADPLSEVLFEYDAIIAEISAYMINNKDILIATLKDR